MSGYRPGIKIRYYRHKLSILRIYLNLNLKLKNWHLKQCLVWNPSVLWSGDTCNPLLLFLLERKQSFLSLSFDYICLRREEQKTKEKTRFIYIKPLNKGVFIPFSISTPKQWIKKREKTTTTNNESRHVMFWFRNMSRTKVRMWDYFDVPSPRYPLHMCNWWIFSEINVELLTSLDLRVVRSGPSPM